MRRLRAFWPFLPFIGLLIFVGCTGSGSGDPMAAAKANAKILAIAGDQAAVGGANFALSALAQTNPTKRPAAVSNTFVPSLGLYKSPGTVSGNSLITHYYKDQAGLTPAGTLTDTVPSETTYSTHYTSFPTVVNTTFNVTSGNLPASGSLVTTYTDAAGANTLTGQYTLTTNKITVQLNLTRNSAGAVAGTITMGLGRTSITVDQLSGTIQNGVTGHVTEHPDGYTGTVTMNLTTGLFSVLLNVGNGFTANAQTDAQGHLNISFSDGSKETVTNPITTNLGTGGTSGGTTGSTTSGTTSGTTGSTTSGTTSGTTGSTTSGTTSGTTGSTTSGTTSGTTGATTGTGYGTPVSIGSTSDFVYGASSSNEMCGYTPLNGGYAAVYWPTRTSSHPSTLPSPNGSNDYFAQGINKFNVIVGYYQGAANSTPVIWATPTTAPTTLPVPAASTFTQAWSINDGGKIVGLSGGPNTGNFFQPVYWSSKTATPVFLAGSPSVSYIAINNVGNIVARNDSSSGSTIYFWSSPTANPVTLQVPTGLNLGAFSGMNNSGVVVGFGLDSSFIATPLAWTSPTAAPIHLKTPSGSTNSRAYQINDAGLIVGLSDSQNSPEVWQNVNSTGTLLTNPSGQADALAIFADGSFVSKGHGGGPLFFVPKQ